MENKEIENLKVALDAFKNGYKGQVHDSLDEYNDRTLVRNKGWEINVSKANYETGEPSNVEVVRDGHSVAEIDLGENHLDFANEKSMFYGDDVQEAVRSAVKEVYPEITVEEKGVGSERLGDADRKTLAELRTEIQKNNDFQVELEDGKASLFYIEVDDEGDPIEIDGEMKARAFGLGEFRFENPKEFVEGIRKLQEDFDRWNCANEYVSFLLGEEGSNISKEVGNAIAALEKNRVVKERMLAAKEAAQKDLYRQNMDYTVLKVMPKSMELGDEHLFVCTARRNFDGKFASWATLNVDYGGLENGHYDITTEEDADRIFINFAHGEIWEKANPKVAECISKGEEVSEIIVDALFEMNEDLRDFYFDTQKMLERYLRQNSDILGRRKLTSEEAVAIDRIIDGSKIDWLEVVFDEDGTPFALDRENYKIIEFKDALKDLSAVSEPLFETPKNYGLEEGDKEVFYGVLRKFGVKKDRYAEIRPYATTIETYLRKNFHELEGNPRHFEHTVEPPDEQLEEGDLFKIEHSLAPETTLSAVLDSHHEDEIDDMWERISEEAINAVYDEHKVSLHLEQVEDYLMDNDKINFIYAAQEFLARQSPEIKMRLQDAGISPEDMGVTEEEMQKIRGGARTFSSEDKEYIGRVSMAIGQDVSKFAEEITRAQTDALEFYKGSPAQERGYSFKAFAASRLAALLIENEFSLERYEDGGTKLDELGLDVALGIITNHFQLKEMVQRAENELKENTKSPPNIKVAESRERTKNVTKAMRKMESDMDKKQNAKTLKDVIKEETATSFALKMLEKKGVTVNLDKEEFTENSFANKGVEENEKGLDPEQPFKSNVSERDLSGNWIPYRNAKIIKEAMENGTAPFLPNEKGEINAEPIYNANTGCCLNAKDLIPLQIERGGRTPIVVTKSSLNATQSEVRSGEKGFFYNFKRVDGSIGTAQFFFPEQTKTPARIIDTAGKNIFAAQGRSQENGGLRAHSTIEITSAKPEEYLASYVAACKMGTNVKVSPEIAEEFKRNFSQALENQFVKKNEFDKEVGELNDLFLNADRKSAQIIKDIERQDKNSQAKQKARTVAMER